MNLTRRQFLKILGVGGAVAVMPRTMLAKSASLSTETGKVSSVDFTVPQQPPGSYIFSYFAKKNEADQWKRYVHYIYLDERQKPLCRVYLKGDEMICMPQFEVDKPSDGYVCNETTGDYTLRNAVSEEGRDTPIPRMTVFRKG